MTSFEQKLWNHNLFNTFDNLVYEYEEIKSEAQNEDQENKIDHLLKIIKFINDRLFNSAPMYVPFNVLDGPMTNISNNLLNDVENYKQEKNIENFYEKSIPRAYNLLIESNKLTTVEDKRNIDRINESIFEFREKANNIIKKIESDETNVNDKLIEIEDKQREIEHKISNYNEDLDKQKKRLDDMLNNIQNQFSDSEKERENNYTELINKLKEDYSSKAENNIQYLNDQINSKIDEMSKEIQTKTDQYYHEFDDILKQIQDKKKYAEDMVRALGNASITGQFQNTADSEKRFSNIFRGIALSLMIVSAVLAIWIIFSVVGKGEFEWQMIFFRIITVGILLIPAFYAAKESEKHREREVSNRKMQLELAALDPFLETLDEESQNQLKKDIANKIFGTQENFTNENVNLNVDNQTLISTIKQILQRSLQS